MFRAVAYDFALDCADPEIAAFLGELLEPLSIPHHAGNRYFIEPWDGGLTGRFRVSLDGADVAFVGSAGAAVDALLSHVNLAAVSATPTHLLLHAGGLTRGPDALVLPAESGSGKTSLTVALVEAGLDYLSDETVAVAVDDLAILPYHKPFTIKASGQHLFPRLRPASGSLAERLTSDYAWHVDARHVRPECFATEVARPALLVAPRYQPGAETRLKRLTRGEAMVALGANSSALRALGGDVLDVLDRVTLGAPAYRLTFSDLEAGRDAVLDLFEHVR